MPITVSRRAPDKEARPSPYHLFLTPVPALSSHQLRTLICLFWSGKQQLCSLTNESHYCSPSVLWAAGCIPQIKLLSLQHRAIPGFPQSDHTVSKVSVDTGSMWNTVKQASRPQKTQAPICLDHRARNRPKLTPYVILQRQMMQNVELIAFSFPADTCEFMVHFSFKMMLFPCSGANYILRLTIGHAKLKHTMC